MRRFVRISGDARTSRLIVFLIIDVKSRRA
jgi:hypothetical protein